MHVRVCVCVFNFFTTNVLSLWVLGVTRHQQWTEHLTNETLLNKFGMSDSLKSMLMERPMRWLGHVCRMDDNQQPKRLLFGELLKPRPFMVQSSVGEML